MTVYIDTGVFIDYLIYRSLSGKLPRKVQRRRRSMSRLAKDVDSCLSKIKRNNYQALTSTLTLFEIENVMFQNITHYFKKGIAYKDSHVVISARIAINQGIATANTYNIKFLDLNNAIVHQMISSIVLQLKSIQSADSLHIITAIQNNAEIFISTDKHMTDLDNTIQNTNGKLIRFVDTDEALNIL